MIPQLWKACKISRPRQLTPHWWPLTHFPQDLAYIFCEIYRSWLQREHEERFNWIILKIRAGELMGLITNGDCECRFAHNKCDIVPTSQESIKVSNQFSWTLVLTQNVFQEKTKHQARFPSVWQLFLQQHFHSSMSSFLSFFRLKKAAAFRQEPMQSHTPPRSIQTVIPKKVHVKQQLESGPIGFQYFLLLENPPHVELSSGVRKMLKRPFWKNYPLSR